MFLGTDKGDGHPSALLEAADVLAIRAKAAAKTETQRGLAARYNVHPGTISDIVCRRTWRHVKAPEDPE